MFFDLNFKFQAYLIKLITKKEGQMDQFFTTVTYDKDDGSQSLSYDDLEHIDVLENKSDSNTMQHSETP